MAPKKTPDDSTYSGRFAIRLYQLRQKAKLSAEQVAEELNVEPTTVYRWESASRFPAFDIFPIYAKILKLKKTRDLYPNE